MDKSFQLHTPDARNKAVKKISNVYEINNTKLYGSREVYEYLIHEGYTGITNNMIARMLTIGKLRKDICDKYPELDPDNPNKIWRCISEGSQTRNRSKTSKDTMIDSGFIVRIVNYVGGKQVVSYDYITHVSKFIELYNKLNNIKSMRILDVYNKPTSSEVINSIRSYIMKDEFSFNYSDYINYFEMSLNCKIDQK